ncbi:MAG TPA: hypothetical protein VL547_07060 [Dinghuibacter sp.]|jgi:hypothetical protein|uniref:hypothetical protein n=1 Tax=Dinghuibacter sp. TaxID=2024697 RepID=UPI002C1F48A6|nr:hypothetical protein [Dinghuibacter sp.]HTJ11765.1 hypothetical protein [Dinghuibacter sp.]
MNRLLPSLTLLCLLCTLTARAQKDPAQKIPDTLMVDASTRDRTRVYAKAEKEPVYPGGPQAWIRDLKAALRQNTASLDDDGVSSMGTCEMQFVVYYDGTTGNVKALTMEQSRLAQVLAEFIDKTSHWTPARQNGLLVNAYLKVRVKYPQ